MSKILEVKNLSKNYGKIKALENISFSVVRGEIFALIGPNGAGKSTALKIIATILAPSAGSIKLLGLDLVKNADEVRKNISYLPEEAGAYKRLTGLEYLNLMATLYTNDEIKQKDFIDKGIKIADLRTRLKDKIGTYSKGMTRKILLARALMSTPKLAILDEPTSGLDVINAMHIRNKIQDFAKGGMAVLLSSHNMLEIEYLSHRVAIIDKGKIHEIGTPKFLKTKYLADNLEEVFMKVVR